MLKRRHREFNPWCFCTFDGNTCPKGVLVGCICKKDRGCGTCCSSHCDAADCMACAKCSRYEGLMGSSRFCHGRMAGTDLRCGFDVHIGGCTRCLDLGGGGGTRCCEPKPWSDSSRQLVRGQVEVAWWHGGTEVQRKSCAKSANLRHAWSSGYGSRLSTEVRFKSTWLGYSETARSSYTFLSNLSLYYLNVIDYV